MRAVNKRAEARWGLVSREAVEEESNASGREGRGLCGGDHSLREMTVS